MELSVFFFNIFQIACPMNNCKYLINILLADCVNFGTVTGQCYKCFVYLSAAIWYHFSSSVLRRTGIFLTDCCVLSM